MPPEADEHSEHRSKFDIEAVHRDFERSLEDENDILLLRFVEAYDELNKFIGMMGKIFQFVQKDVKEKTSVLKQLAESDPVAYKSVEAMVEAEKERRDKPGTKALIPLSRALEFIVKFMLAFADAGDDASVSAICRSCYDLTLAKFHPWVVRKAVGLASYTLPNRRTLIENVGGPEIGDDLAKEVLNRVAHVGQQVHARIQRNIDDGASL